MARCGIRLRYPVQLIMRHDDGADEEGQVIGDAETLGQALALAERQGFQVREASDGGHSRLTLDDQNSPLGFWVTIYPE